MARKKKKEEQTGLEPGADLVSSRIRPVDIQQQEFRTSFRGYSPAEVDAFLDRLTEDLAAVTDENKRLKDGLPVGDAGAEAEAVLRDARAQADAIIRQARSEAAAAPTGAATTGDAMAAVWPFLNREREFLRSLAAMVQEHAEGVKGQARDLQDASKRSAGQAPSASKPAESSKAATGSAWTATSGKPTSGAPTGKKEEPVVAIPPSPVDTPPKSEEEPSLRELFWGEDA